ncbi:hypothetical protein [Streptomyces axinellae]|uniref:Integral membrane protein n=1 Tax=Streptomyces axinellae TaxID=552788 RepID=A0ABN3QJR8_9ACTN
MSAVTETEPGPGEDGPRGEDGGGESADRHSERPRSGAPARLRAWRTAPASASVRAWTVGWAAGTAQALGAALLLITEFVRRDVGGLGEPVRPGTGLPHYAAGFPHLAATLGDQWWFRLLGEARDAMSFGEPRAALWAAVCAALVVRLNKDGPPRTQCFLSLAGALYCAVAALSAIPYLALPGFALPFVLVLGAVAVVGATPGWRRRLVG